MIICTIEVNLLLIDPLIKNERYLINWIGTAHFKFGVTIKDQVSVDAVIYFFY